MNKYLATINFYLCPGDLLLRALLVAGDRCCKPQVLRFSPAVHIQEWDGWMWVEGGGAP